MVDGQWNFHRATGEAAHLVMPTRQDIAERIAAVYEESTRAREKTAALFMAEIQSLQELCGGLGHDYETWNRLSWQSLGQDHATTLEMKICRVCEWRFTATDAEAAHG